MSWSDFFKDVIDVGKSLLGKAAKAGATLIAGAKRFVDQAWTSLQKTFRGDPESEGERIERELQEVNERVQNLRKRLNGRRDLTSAERREWDRLKQQREALIGQLREIALGVNTKEMVEQEKSYAGVEITDETSHILQYHVGQSTFNKTCECGRPMVLQWKRDLVTAGLKDFFWACSGWYIVDMGRRVCTRIKPLRGDELSLFANLRRPEFDLESKQLTEIVLTPSRSARVRSALDSIRDDHRKRRIGIKTYRCPFHGESLVLKRKHSSSNGFFDEYFLGCPRWLPNKRGCGFLVKLKSAAQVSSVLDIEYRKGLIEIAH